MIITVKKEQIIDGLQKAASIIPSKAGAAYLRSIWLQAAGSGETGRLTLMATDVNIEFTGTYPAEVREEGQAGVNGRAFVELLRRLPGGDIQLRLDKESNTLLVEQGRRSYKLPAADPVWFQALPPFPEPCCGQETSFRTLSTVFPSASAMTTAPKHSPASASRVWSRARWTSAA